MDELTRDDYLRIGKRWLDRIKAADKREDAWVKQAEAAENAYLACEEGSGKVYDFNILHSNIETMAPAVYNSPPVPEIRERFRSGDEGPETALARQVAQVIERAISVQIDDGALDVELQGVTQDAILAGRGIVRVRFDADEGPNGLTNERVRYEVVSWRDYREGPAKRWSEVPWTAYRHCLPWENVQKIQDPKIREVLSAGKPQGETEPEADADTHIWEVWDKDAKEVLMIVDETGEVLSIQDDPMGLRGFFPSTMPVQPITATGKRTPVCPFTVYKKLADELEKLTKRINKIIDALKVKGAFPSAVAEDLALFADADDNTLTSIANIDGAAAVGGLDNSIAWWPVESAVAVLTQLYLSREQVKAQIYEVTGISDIIRGQGDASETATAQEIKTQWGSLRVRKLQREIERCAREVMVLSAEIISSKFSLDTLQRMTGMQIPQEGAQMLQAPLDFYRIDVETDSTVRGDLARRKGETGEFLNGTGAFFTAMAPLVGAAPAMAEPVAELYGAFGRHFNLGKQAEDALEKLVQFARQAAQQAAQAASQPSPEQQVEAKKMELAERKEDREDKKLILQERKDEIDALATVASIDGAHQKELTNG